MLAEGYPFLLGCVLSSYCRCAISMTVQPFIQRVSRKLDPANTIWVVMVTEYTEIEQSDVFPFSVYFVSHFCGRKRKEIFFGLLISPGGTKVFILVTGNSLSTEVIRITEFILKNKFVISIVQDTKLFYFHTASKAQLFPVKRIAE